jgi:hypothetical protein
MRTRRSFHGELLAVNRHPFSYCLTIVVLLLTGCLQPSYAQTAIVCGQTITASISQPGEIDIHTFSVQPGEVVRFVTISPLRNYMELLTAAGAPVAAAENTLETALSQGGSYKLLVRSYFNTQTFDYNLTFQQLKNPCGAAQFICGQLLKSTIAKPSQSDLRTITVVAGEVVRVTMISALRNYIELIDANGVRVSAAENVLQVPLPQGGRYTVLVRSYFYSQVFDYDISFQQLKKPCGAAQLGCGQLVTDSIARPSESHLRTIDVAAGEVVRIVMVSALRNYIELIDSSGAAVTAAENVLQTTIAQGGRYTVLVRSYFYSQAFEYNLSFQQLRNPCAATELRCSETVHRPIAKASEMHLYHVRVAPGEIGRFVIASPLRNFMELFDANGVSLGAAENVLQVPMSAGGRYTLLVRSYFYSQAFDYHLTLTQLVNPCPPSTCVGTLTPSYVSRSSAAAPVTIAVAVSAGCTWTAVSNSPWITVSNVNIASGTATLALASNITSQHARAGSVTIAKNTLSVSQGGTTCFYTVSPGSKSAADIGDSGSVTVSATPGCAWQAIANDPWISVVAGAAGTGNGQVRYTIAPNTTAAARQGTITVANQTYTVTQAAASSTYTCTGAASPKNVRAGGVAELASSISVTCSGPVPPGGTRGDLIVALNTTVASRITTPDLTEAVLLLNSPSVPVLGTNAFQGRLDGFNAIRFKDIPLGTTGQSSDFRIENLRVNASRFGIGSTVVASLEVKSSAIVALKQDLLVIGNVQQGGTAAADASTPGPTAATRTIPVVFTETFENAYKRKISPGQQQSEIGTEYNSESGYMHPSLGPLVGAADQGSRFRLRITNIPAGVRVYAPVNPTASAAAQLVSADLNGNGGGFLSGTTTIADVAYREIVPVGGITSTTWEAIAPVATAVETYTFPIVVENATAEQADQIRASLQAGFAPLGSPIFSVGNIPVPRFAGSRLTALDLRIFPYQTAVSAKSPARNVVGSNARFAFKVVNDSVEAATQVVIRGSAPIGYSFVRCTRSDNGPCEVSGWSARAVYGELPPGMQTIIELEAAPLQNSAAGTLLETSASVASDDDDVDLTSNRASAVAAVTCETTLSPSFTPVPRAGGLIDVGVTTCGSWIAVTSVPWITIVSGSPGLGNGTVRLSAAANIATSPRTAAVSIAGVQVVVSQAGADCATSVEPVNDSVPAQGKQGTFQLTACGEWTATSNAPWLQVYPLTGPGSQAVTYTVFPYFKSAPRTGTITINGVPFAVTQSAATGTNDERFVRFIYFNFVGRLPSSAELASQVAALAAGTTRAQLVLNFFNSLEFNLGGRFIAGLYVGLLDRDAEYSGWLFQRNALATGIVPQVQLVSNFMNSAEYRLKFPNTAADSFVRQLYRYILLRDPDAGETAFHITTSLTPNTLTARISLASSFLNTSEFRRGTGTRLTVFLIYATLLQRDPIGPEAVVAAAELDGGAPPIDLIRRIVESREFIDQFN